MPSPKIDEVLATKPVTFSLKTSGGSWKCQIHPTRAAYEKSRVVTAPGITRTDSGFSTASSSSAGSTASSH